MRSNVRRMRLWIIAVLPVCAVGVTATALGQGGWERRRTPPPAPVIAVYPEHAAVVNARVRQPGRLGVNVRPVARVGAYVSDQEPIETLPAPIPGGPVGQMPAGGFPYPRLLHDEASGPSGSEKPIFPPGYVPWWQREVMHPLRESSQPRLIDLDWLVVNALAYSPYVRAISDDVLIQETGIVEAEAVFDVHEFLESKFVRNSNPVGNLLETGGPSRLREGDWRFEAGLRKRNAIGGSWEVAQRIGLRDSNSRFFLPPHQGNSRLTLSFNQPLLNGAGRAYNTALIVLADIDTTKAMDRTSKSLQEHLVRISRAYWELYLQRTLLLQQQRHLQRAKIILETLLRRRDVDSLESQIVRARAAVAARHSELIRATTNIRNMEARIRSLTGAPELFSNPYVELIPRDYPTLVPVRVSLRDAMITALRNRPEIDEASLELRAASVRLKMSRKELLPALDLVLETYVAGLQAHQDIGRAWADQFSVGEPGYTAGLVFEVPLGRRLARSRHQRRQLQLRQLTQQFDQTVKTLLTEVEVAIRDVDTTYETMFAKFRAMKAADMEIEYSTRRWQLMSGEERSASFLLEDLLDAQDRLVTEEFGFATAQRDYTISLIELKRVTGTLLQEEQIEPVRTCQSGLPQLDFQKVSGLVSPDQVLPNPPTRTSPAANQPMRR